jgi:hypothetical protein
VALENLIGKKYGRLTVIDRDENTSRGKAKWICLCDCGNVKTKSVLGYDLKSGKVRSCGCLYKESNKEHNARHAMTNSRIYGIWSGMKGRCKRNDLYRTKDVAVCPEWENSFEAFYEWSTANGYADNLTIDRIDNNKGYSPDNCRWVSMKVQQNNRTNNRIVSYFGKEYTLSQLGELLGISSATLRNRLVCGWSERELNLKPNYKNKRIRRIIYELN